MDNLTKEQRSKNMRAIKFKNTKMETIVCKALWSKGIRFRKNVMDLPGKPDIAIKKYKIVIFLDSCFWHKCPRHYTKPKTNSKFWENKIEANAIRDKEVNKYYSDYNWQIIRVWEHELKQDFDSTLNKIFNIITNLQLIKMGSQLQ